LISRFPITAYNCSTCKDKTTAEKGTKFIRLPKVLTFAFKRFDYDYEVGASLRIIIFDTLFYSYPVQIPAVSGLHTAFV